MPDLNPGHRDHRTHCERWFGSVWLTGQLPSRDQRRGRHTPESMAHPGKTLDLTVGVGTTAAGTDAGFQLADRRVALIAGIRDGRLVPRTSSFQLRNHRAALADADPQWLVQPEDVLVFHAGLERR